MTEEDRKVLESAQADRDALLAALSFRTGPLGADRDMILSEAAGRLPAMVKAREKLRDYAGDALLWQCLCGEGGPPVTPLLLTVWKQRKAAKKQAVRLRAALEKVRELNMEEPLAPGYRWASSDLIDQTIAAALAAIEGERP